MNNRLENILTTREKRIFPSQQALNSHEPQRKPRMKKVIPKGDFLSAGRRSFNIKQSNKKY
jgi:hypothetical protein